MCKYMSENNSANTAAPTGVGGGETPPSREGEIMPEIMCPYPKPTETEPCGLSACTPKWVVSNWEQVGGWTEVVKCALVL